MADVFVSYSRRDTAFVDELNAFLTADGRDVWVDLEDIPPGALWERDIDDNIDGADSFVFVVSTSSLASQYCTGELGHAEKRGKRIVPVALDGANPDDAPTGLRQRNWIWIRDGDDRAAPFAALTKALDTDLAWSQAHTNLLREAVEWEDGGRSSNRLLRGKDIDAAERALADHAGSEPRPTELQQRYVVASRRDATRRQRTLLGGVSVALLVAVALAVAALLQRNTAIRERDSARSLALAAASDQQRTSHLEVALLLGVEANRRRPGPEARSSMIATLERADRSETKAILRADGSVTDVVFSPDRRTLAVVESDGDVRLWDLETHRVTGRLKGAGATSVAFSPDGKTAATIGANLQLWTVRTRSRLGRPLVTLRTRRRPGGPRSLLDEKLAGVAFSPDGGTLADGLGTTVQLWDLADRRLRGRLTAPAYRDPNSDVIVPPSVLGAVSSVAFSRDGRWLAASRRDSTRVWNLRDPGPARRLPVSAGSDISFAPDGELLTANSSGGLDIRRASDGGLVRRLGEDQFAEGAALSPNGRILATAAIASVTLRDVRTPRSPLAVLQADADSAPALWFSPDSRLLAGVGQDNAIFLWTVGAGLALPGGWLFAGDTQRLAYAADGTARLAAYSAGGEPTRTWTADAQERFGPPHTAPVRVSKLGVVDDLEFSRDGRRAVASSATDKFARVWNVRTGRGLGRFEPKTGLDASALSANGALVVSGGDKGKAWIWKADSGEVVRPLDPHGGAILSVAFSPDGTRIVTGSSDNQLRLFDVASGHLLGTLRGHTDLIRRVVFDPDGKRIASSSNDGTVRIWDVRSHKQKGLAFGGRADDLLDVAFGAHGRTVATTRLTDGSVRLWDVASHQQLGAPLLLGGGTIAVDVAFSPDGDTVAVLGDNGEVRFWPHILWRNLPELRARVCNLVWGNLTKSEWATYAPGLPPHATCGTP